MNTKIKTIAGWTLSILVSLVAISSGIAKIAGASGVVEGLTKVHLIQYRILLGTMELFFAGLFLYPTTIKLGFILFSCYFAGALAVDLAEGSVIAPIVILVLSWIGAFLRKPNIFLNDINA